ncbi:MAG: hypothetical protein DI568_04835 [Sphingomonas sp.]|nr:MAG: hypothetical protein DI568_04835 [Sphingomonas sp.]
MELRPILIAALLLSGCGYKGALTRLEPPDPALTREQQKEARTAEKRMVTQGLTVAADARPLRVDDLTVKLEVRRDDPFSLPPEGTQTSRKVPFPGEEVVSDSQPFPTPAATPSAPTSQVPQN